MPQRVLALPGRLGLTVVPGARDSYLADARATLARDLRDLREVHGASTLVTLLEPNEMQGIGVPGLPAAARCSGLESLWLPIPDGDVPPLVEAGSLVEAMAERLAAGRTVVVHCYAGLGRSGTIAACLLAVLGRPPALAVARVRAARPGAIHSALQEAFVSEFWHEFGARLRGLSRNRATREAAGKAGA